MQYKRSIQLTFTALAAAVPLRAALKILTVDLENGFYLGMPVAAAVFRAVLLGFSAVIAWTCLRESDPGIGPVRGNRWLELTAALLGLALLGVGASTLFSAQRLSFHFTAVNTMPKWVVLTDGALACLSGLVFLYLSAHLSSGAAQGPNRGSLALVPVVWHTVSMIRRYSEFHQVLTVSDQLMETVFLLLTTLFLLAHTRTLAGVGANRRRCMLWALTAPLYGFSLSLGQLAGRAVLGSEISGPPTLRLLVILALSLYEMTYAVILARTPVAAENES